MTYFNVQYYIDSNPYTHVLECDLSTSSKHENITIDYQENEVHDVFTENIDTNEKLDDVSNHLKKIIIKKQ